MTDHDGTSPRPDRLRAEVTAAASRLAVRDEDLARLLERHGPPPVWHRGAGFTTLVHTILGQQVSLASARSALDRSRRAVGGDLTPEALVATGIDGLRAHGLTRQKASYLVGVAESVVAGRLDLDGLDGLTDDEVIAALVAERGIGRWTADIHLLMGMARPDVWPSGDLALIIAARTWTHVGPTASGETVAQHATRWAPDRSTAARMLWHAYLLERGRPLDEDPL
ncbi:MAG: DNA-3-methyladenine glycosylase 2 family protein [Chloroflexi bacterium]|nr:DNA-3-methyladenine glycosylase 2 family protein [Chloroflexota bacterium]